MLGDHSDPWQCGGMADSSKRVNLGPSGDRVRERIKELRGGMQYKELSERLSDLGRPIAPLGLRRIEAGERRVDVDDLVALAVAFGVSPLTLLLPDDASDGLASEVTGVTGQVSHNVQWQWMLGEEPLDLPDLPSTDAARRAVLEFRLAARPETVTPRNLAIGYFVNDNNFDMSKAIGSKAEHQRITLNK